MRGRLGEELLRLPVCFNGIELGRPVDVLLDLEASRAVGLEVVCGDDERRFLPLAVTTMDDDSIAIESPLLLVDESGLSFYREEARTLRALRGARIEQPGVEGVLRDVVLGEDGTIEAVVLATRRRSEESAARRPEPFETLGPGSPNLLPEAIVTRNSARVCDGSGPNVS